MHDTIIIGAGAAGLMAARELVRAGKKVLILECADRIGGRILTLYDTNAGIPVELGAEFIHGEAPETNKLLDEAHLASVPVSGEHYRSDRGEFAQQGPVWERMKHVFSHLSERRKDRSFQDFLDEKPGGRRLASERELAFGFVQGFNGADTSLISANSLAEQGDPTEGASEAARVVNGYGAIINHLQRDLSEVIRTGVRVTRIKWNESGVQVTGHGGREYESRTVILTVPLPMLQDRSIVFEPDIPTVRRAAAQLEMGHVIRVSVVVKKRFWEKKAEELSFVHSPTRPFNVWWTQHPIKAPLITGWAGGPPALELTRSGTVETSTISELARAFGTKRGRMETVIESIHTHPWSLDDNVRGAYSYVGVGGTSASRILARPIGNTIYLAGEATDSGSSGTVEGALASAKRTVKKILDRLS